MNTRAWIGAALVAAALALPGSPASANPGPRALLRSAVGVVKVMRASSGVWLDVSATRDRNLYAGDHVLTGQHGAAIISIDGVWRALAPNTHVIVPGRAERDEGSSLWVIVGRVFIWVVGAQHAETGSQAAVAAAEGTRFVYDVAEDGTVVVTVLEGTVVLRNEFGRVTVRAREQSTVVPGSAPSAPMRVDPSGFFAWEASLELAPPGWEQRYHPEMTREQLEAAAEGARAEGGLPLGELLVDLGEMLGAEVACRAALEAEPGNAKAQLCLGWALLAQARVADAQAIFEAARAEPPAGVEGLLGLAACLASAGPERHASAAELAARALEREPTSADAMTMLGLLALRGGDAPGASAWLRRAVQAAPEAWQAQAWLAHAALAVGDADAAVTAADEAVARAPASPLARATLATVEFFAGDLALAREQVDLALAWSPDVATAWLLSSDIYVAQGDLEAGLADAQFALTCDPYLAPAYAAVGTILLARNALPQAERAFARALALDPECVSARTGMGLTWARQGRLGQALEQQKAAIALDSSRAAAHNNLGATHLALGELDAAVEQFETAIDLQPGWAMPHANLAIAWLDLNRFADALREAELAVALGADSARVHTTLARVYLEQNRVERARIALRRALELDEDYALAHLHMAEVCVREGLPREAVRHQLEGVTQQPSAMLETREYARTEATVAAPARLDLRRDGRGDDGLNSYFLHAAYEEDERERLDADWRQWSALAIGGRQPAPDTVHVGWVGWQREERDRPGRLGPAGVEDPDYRTAFSALDARYLLRMPAGEDNTLRLKLGWVHQSIHDTNPDAMVADPKPFRRHDVTVSGPTAELRLDRRLDPERTLIAGVAMFDEERDASGVLGTSNPPGAPQPVTWQRFASGEERGATTLYGWYRSPVGPRTDLMVGGRAAFRHGVDAVVRPEGRLRYRLPPDGTLVLLTRPVLRDDVSELAPVDDWALTDPLSPLDLATGGWSQSWEAVYELAPRDGSILRAGAFYRELRNLIVDLQDPRLAPGVAGLVVASGTVRGGEIEWERRLGGNLSGGILVRYTDSDNDDAGGAELPLQPDWTGRLRLDYLDEGGTRIGVQWLHVGERWADAANTALLGAHDVVDLWAAHQVDLHTDLFLSIENVLDESYAYWPGYPADGTRVRGGVQYRF